MSLFDRAHMTFYSTLIETMHLYHFRYTVSYLSKVIDFNLHHLNLCPTGSDLGGISLLSLASKNKRPWATMWCCLCDPMLSRFSRIPTCDRQTQSHSIHHASIMSHGKNAAMMTD